MGDFTANRPVFLNFCKDALEKIHGDHSFEADRLRGELEQLSQKLEGWAYDPNPPDKDRIIAAVMAAYRHALDLAAQAQAQAQGLGTSEPHDAAKVRKPA